MRDPIPEQSEARKKHTPTFQLDVHEPIPSFQLTTEDLVAIGTYSQIPPEYLQDLPFDQKQEYDKCQAIIAQYTGRPINELADDIIEMARHVSTDTLQPRDTFHIQDGIEALQRACIHEPPRRVQSGERFSPEYMQARKQFVISLADRFARIHQESTSDKQVAEVKQLSDTTEYLLFSNSPNLADYIGGTNTMIEVALAVHKAPTLHRLDWELSEQLIQQVAFTDRLDELKHNLTERANTGSTLDTLQALKFYNSLTVHGIWAGSYGERAAHTIQEIIDTFTHSPIPLIALAATQYQKNYKLNLHNEIPLNADTDTHIYHVEKHGYSPAYTLPRNMEGYYSITALSSDYVGMRDPWGTVTMAEQRQPIQPPSPDELALQNAYRILRPDSSDPEAFHDIRSWLIDTVDDEEIVATLQQLSTSQELYDYLQHYLVDHLPTDKTPLHPEDLSTIIAEYNIQAQDVLLLIQELHRPAVREALENHIGVSLTQLSLREQLSLLSFLTKANQDTFDRLCRITKGSWMAPGFLKAFIALESDETYGESLLSIAEAYPGKAAIIYELGNDIQKIESSAAILAQLFEKVDTQFATEIKQSVIKRVTEILAVIENGAKGNDTVIELYDGSQLEITAADAIAGLDVIGDIQRALQSLLFAIEIKQFRLVQNNGGLTTYISDRSVEPTPITIQLRSQAASLGQHQATREYDGEARINFLIGLDSDQDIPDNISDPLRQSALSIRLDREGYIYNAQGEIIGNDPTQAQGAVSLDIGSIYGEPGNINVRVAKFIAAGNVLMAQKRGQRPSLNHMREVFDSRYGQSQEFANIVRGLEAILLQSSHLDEVA